MRWKPEDSKMKESREQLNPICRSDQQKNQPAQKCANKSLIVLVNNSVMSNGPRGGPVRRPKRTAKRGMNKCPKGRFNNK